MVTKSAKGKDLVTLTSTVRDDGTVITFSPNGKQLVELGAASDDTGGLVHVYNKTGENIATAQGRGFDFRAAR